MGRVVRLDTDADILAELDLHDQDEVASFSFGVVTWIGGHTVADFLAASARRTGCTVDVETVGNWWRKEHQIRVRGAVAAITDLVHYRNRLTNGRGAV